MPELDYYLAYDDGNILIRANNNATIPAEVVIDRYDRTLGKWIRDFDMCGIYSGDIPVRTITEAEAYRRIAAGQR
ncbi:hypothetical protein [Bilifractor porci]|uniref:Uncharacterized protein n=1 Tax=Bilifractor porci TaxID=2606636 RepID=A0A7X2TQC7_9FIRM|nr:hypothetical protein [Bilifractor porci]MST82868.1 hypothetical protein [Bilifractor porci]